MKESTIEKYKPEIIMMIFTAMGSQVFVMITGNKTTSLIMIPLAMILYLLMKRENALKKKTIIADENGQTSPIMAIFTFMIAIIVMGFLMLISGSIIDVFLAEVADLRISYPLGTWGDSMMDELPLKYAPYVFYIPPFFLLMLLVWVIKTTIKRHQYTKQENQYVAGDEDF